MVLIVDNGITYPISYDINFYKQSDFNEFWKSAGIFKFKDEIIGNYNWTRWEESGMAEAYGYAYKDNNHFVTATVLQNVDSNVLRQMVSTFKFTK